MTLQPMATAPRDGSWVWCALGQNLIYARWDDDQKNWYSGGYTYDSGEFSGWLDIEVLQLDSERLEMLYEIAKVSRGGQIEIELSLSQSADWDGTTCLWDRTVFRAAIDKEAVRAFCEARFEEYKKGLTCRPASTATKSYSTTTSTVAC